MFKVIAQDVGIVVILVALFTILILKGIESENDRIYKRCLEVNLHTAKDNQKLVCERVVNK